jgi:hypothetical protein
MSTAFEQVPDFRDRKGQTYRLWSLLALVLVGFLCGRRGLRAVYRSGRAAPVGQRLRLGFRRDKMPCHSALTETRRAVDANCLAALLGRAILRAASSNAPSRGCLPKRSAGVAEYCADRQSRPQARGQRKGQWVSETELPGSSPA